MVIFYVFLEIILFCFFIAICDLVDDVEAVFHLSQQFKTSLEIFSASLIFQKRFSDHVVSS